MTKTVFNWRALLGLIVVAVVVCGGVTEALIYFEVIPRGGSSMLIGGILGFGVGWFWPYRAFETVEDN